MKRLYFIEKAYTEQFKNDNYNIIDFICSEVDSLIMYYGKFELNGGFVYICHYDVKGKIDGYEELSTLVKWTVSSFLGTDNVYSKENLITHQIIGKISYDNPTGVNINYEIQQYANKLSHKYQNATDILYDIENLDLSRFFQLEE